MPSLKEIDATTNPPVALQSSPNAADNNINPIISSSDNSNDAYRMERMEGKWNDDEKKGFQEGVILFGWSSWKSISEFVGTRNTNQTKSHAQKIKQNHPELMAKLVHEHNKVNKGPPKKRKIIPIGFKALPKSKRILKQLSAMSTSSSDESELGDGSGTPSSTATSTSSSNTKIEIDQDGGISTNKSNREEAAMLVALRKNIIIEKKEEKTPAIHDEEPAKDTSSITTGVETPSFSAAGCGAGVAKTAHDAIQLMREDLIDFNWTEVRASSGATTTTKERDVKATAAEDTSSTRTNSASDSVTCKTTQDAIKLPSNWAERLLEEEIGIS